MPGLPAAPVPTAINLMPLLLRPGYSPSPRAICRGSKIARKREYCRELCFGSSCDVPYQIGSLCRKVAPQTNARKKMHPTLSLIITVGRGEEVGALPKSLWQENALTAPFTLESALGL